MAAVAVRTSRGWLGSKSRRRRIAAKSVLSLIVAGLAVALSSCRARRGASARRRRGPSRSFSESIITTTIATLGTSLTRVEECPEERHVLDGEVVGSLLRQLPDVVQDLVDEDEDRPADGFQCLSDLFLSA